MREFELHTFTKNQYENCIMVECLFWMQKVSKIAGWFSLNCDNQSRIIDILTLKIFLSFLCESSLGRWITLWLFSWVLSLNFFCLVSFVRQVIQDTGIMGSENGLSEQWSHLASSQYGLSFYDIGVSVGKLPV